MQKRVWKTVDVRAADEGFGITLDDRPLRTPAKAELRVPTRALAEAIAAEWDAVGDKIDPTVMRTTRTANSALDKVTLQKRQVAEMLAAYGDADLICYRAVEPEGLVARQAEAWDRWLDWSRTTLGAPLLACAGVVHQPQPAESLATLRSVVDGYDPFRLTGLHDLVTLSGSLILGLAVARGALDWQEGWDISRVDESWQQELWGVDEEAAAAAQARRADFHAAQQFLELLGN